MNNQIFRDYAERCAPGVSGNLRDQLIGPGQDMPDLRAGDTQVNHYPPDWPEIARRVKEEAGWRCVRCGHPHERPSERVPCDDRCDASRHTGGLNDGKRRGLTVHHLNGDKADCRWWNLAALCQACHLSVQARVIMSRAWLLPHSEWFRPYVAGYYAWFFRGEELDRSQVERWIDELLALQVHMKEVVTIERSAPPTGRGGS